VKSLEARKQELDNRYSTFPNFHLCGYSVKVFSSICGTTIRTGNENIMILRQLFHTFGSDYGFLLGFETSQDFIAAARSLVDLMDLVYDFEIKWTDLDLETLSKAVLDVHETWGRAFVDSEGERVINFHTRKYHVLNHLVHFIRLYGSLMGCDTGIFEPEHISVHFCYKKNQKGKGNAEERLINQLNTYTEVKNYYENRLMVESQVAHDVEDLKFIGISSFLEASYLNPLMSLNIVRNCLALVLGKGIDEISDNMRVFTELRLSKGHVLVCKHNYKTNRGLLESRFDFLRVNSSESELWFGQVLLFILYEGNCFALIRNLSNTGTLVRGFLKFTWQTENFEGGLNCVPVQSIISKVFMVKEYGIKSESFLLDRWAPGANKTSFLSDENQSPFFLREDDLDNLEEQMEDEE
jgi:hypothetical protein